jgi:hypothetical protein
MLRTLIVLLLFVAGCGSSPTASCQTHTEEVEYASPAKPYYPLMQSWGWDCKRTSKIRNAFGVAIGEVWTCTKC